MVFRSTTLFESYQLLLLAWIIRGRVVALDPDDDDAMTTSNGTWVNVAIIVGLSGGLLLLLFMLLKVSNIMFLLFTKKLYRVGLQMVRSIISRRIC